MALLSAYLIHLFLISAAALLSAVMMFAASAKHVDYPSAEANSEAQALPLSVSLMQKGFTLNGSLNNDFGKLTTEQAFVQHVQPVNAIESQGDKDQPTDRRDLPAVILHRTAQDVVSIGLRTPASLLPQCMRRWGSFGKEPLTQSQVMSSRCTEPQDFSNFDQGESDTKGTSAWSTPFVSVANRFAFCAIPKAASSSWRGVFQQMYWNNTANLLTCGEGDTSSTPPPPSAGDLQRVFSDPGAITATMLREPLSRFVSAFFDKCNRTGGVNASQQDVLECPLLAQGTPSMKDVVEWFLGEDPRTLGTHWKLQSEFCELRSRLNEYGVILYYSKETASIDATCMLEKIGALSSNSIGPACNNAPIWVDLCGDETVTGPDVNSCTSDDESTKMKLLFKKEDARRLISHLRQDYNLFNFPEPAWVADATGEFDSTEAVELPW